MSVQRATHTEGREKEKDPIRKVKQMTFLTALFPYKGPLHEREMRALDDVRDVYGIRIVSIDERKQRILVEYDASRLLQSDILFMLRNAGIRLQNDIGTAA